jgi:hypothetical protein
MNEKEGLNLLDFLATGINRDDPFIQAMFSNYEGGAAIANEVEEAISFIDYYTRTDDVRGHGSDSLEMIAKQFAKLRRQLQEKDSRLLRRLLALTERKGDVIWVNALNMKHVFEIYFENISAFISENTNADSLLADGDFEENGWELSGSAGYAYEARFSGLRGLFFEGPPASAVQSVNDLSSGWYAFHFFLSGKCGVKIRNSQGKYWDGTAEAGNYVLAWKDEPFINVFESVEWNDVYCLIRISGELLDELTIEFVPVSENEAKIDYARLFAKPANPSYTITFRYEGYSLAAKTLHLGVGNADPVDGVNYKKESYFDHSYIVGREGALRSEIYRSLLDTVRPRGVQAFVEYVEKTDLGEDNA